VAKAEVGVGSQGNFEDRVDQLGLNPFAKIWLVITLQRYEIAILWIMGVFQILWLAGIWLFGASSDWPKLIGIGIYSLLGTGMILVLSKRIDFNSIGWLKSLLQNEKRMLIILGAICLVIGVVYASIQRIWPFDEEENFRIASIFAKNGFSDFLTAYTTSPYFANRHPPLVALLDGSIMSIFGISLFVARLVSVFFCLGIIILTFYCGRELYDIETGFLSAALLLTFPLMMRLGSVAMLDIPVTFFFLLSIFLFLSIAKKPSWWKALILGTVIGAGFLSRYSGIFVLPILGIFSLLTASYRRVIPYLILAFLLMGLILIGWLIFVHSHGMTVPNISRFLPIGLKAKDVKDLSVLPGWMANPQNFSIWRFVLNSLITRLPSAIGVHNLPLIALGIVLVISTRRLPGAMLLIWIAIVSIILILTLPDHRYFMPVFPALAILAGSWLRSRPAITFQVIALALLLSFGALYLFVDWQREAQLFFP
jgi:4-amino-4-deoxy-L-arabinose transferase-like glycosyltransferase